ncbi:hypothetical protein CDD80_600 [Ophiocordyceps camponoti-rufipedis]|uniref:Major facilitator superfamily (MFS) profile domain-containing protein n=1 Tax=Ophiocordyceps camponoti-rufipedis TaxID=2004952 RepID=A0A2C5ZE15_9HYPO|nr:hypothetical protein CDD80_600 [Ophiocordyceps camponoti-rufipedis]
MTADEKPDESVLHGPKPFFVEDELPVDAADEKRLVRKQDARLLPLSTAIYFLCFLDRANMGNARILNSTTHDDMRDSTGMSQRQFDIALLVFAISYAIFEVPSNMLLKKLRPSRWLAFLMFGWGAMTISLSGTHSFATVTAVRFLLGVFEAGLFPGLVFYMTFWYRHDERSVRVAFVLASATLAGAFGGAIAFGVGHLNGIKGLPGWRWLFIIEGIPSCVSSMLVFFLLPDFPESASWLSESEKALSAKRLLHEGSNSHHKTASWTDAKETLTDWRLYAHYAMYFCVNAPFAGLSLFAPSLTAGLGFKDLQAQLMTVPPWAVTYVCQIAVAYSADRFNARGAHTAGAALVGAAGFAASAALPPTAYKARYGALFLAAIGTFAGLPPMLGWLTSNLFSTASTGLAVAINVSVGGGLGSIPGILVYNAQEASAGYPTGHWTNTALLLVVAVVALSLRFFYVGVNKRLAADAARRGTQARLFKL